LTLFGLTLREIEILGFNDIYRAVVTNKAKLVYESVGDWLEGKDPIPEQGQRVEGLEEQLRLYKFRSDNGALELETIEASPVLKEGEIVDLAIIDLLSTKQNDKSPASFPDGSWRFVRVKEKINNI